MTDERPRPDEGSGDDDFDRIVAGLELSMPDDLEADPEPPEQDVFDPRLSDPLDAEDQEDQERFVPPVPEPLPPLDTVSKAAWTVLFGAPAVLLIAVVIAWELPRTVTGVLVVGFVGALVLLLLKRGNQNRGDDPDQGAVL